MRIRSKIITKISRLSSERYRVTTQRQTIYITPYYTLTYILQLTIYPTRRLFPFLSSFSSAEIRKKPMESYRDVPSFVASFQILPQRGNHECAEGIVAKTETNLSFFFFIFSAANRFLFFSPRKLRAEIRRACEYGKSQCAA